MGLDVAVRKGLGGSSLLRIIEEKLAWDGERLPIGKGSVLRASGVAELCPREEVLCAVYDVIRRDKGKAGLSLIFAHGAGLHDILQNRVLVQAGVLLGQWRCVGCGFFHGEIKPDVRVEDCVIRRPDKCSKCSTAKFLYEEPYAWSERYQIGGHTDGFLALPGHAGLGLLEAKSINPRGAWQVRDTPNVGHVVQLQTYLWLFERQWGKILYWDKAGNGVDALIEHHVDRDEDTITQVKETIDSILNGSRTGVLPERICATHDCTRAKACVVSKKCFEVQNQVEVTSAHAF